MTHINVAEAKKVLQNSILKLLKEYEMVYPEVNITEVIYQPSIMGPGGSPYSSAFVSVHAEVKNK